jgi:hypothetical protein
MSQTAPHEVPHAHLDESGQRGARSGSRKAGLPSIQS